MFYIRIVLLFFLLGLAAPTPWAASIKNISDLQVTELQNRFMQAKRFLSPTEINVVLNKMWTCELFGMSSRLQRESGISLYRFRQNKTGKFENSGSQPARHYEWKPNGLVGSHRGLVDTLRFIPEEEQLIAEVSALQPLETKVENSLTALNSVKRVIAYAFCR